jgi:uncharacterized membrane protein YfcA
MVGLFLTGLAAGFLGALLGFGGGILLVPALTLIFHLPFKLAVATSLVGVLTTSASVGAVIPKHRKPDVELGLRLELATVAGALIGSLLVAWINDRTLSLIFSAAMLFSSGYIALRARWGGGEGMPERAFQAVYQPRHWPIAIGLSSIAGLLAGMLGVGGGFLKVPIIYAVMDVPLGVASLTSNFMVGITAAASLFVYGGRGDIHALVVVPTALGVLTGALIGVRTLMRVEVRRLRIGLVLLLLFVAAQMALRGLGRI